MMRRTVLTTLSVLLGACGAGDEPAPERITGVVIDVRPGSGPVRSFAVETSFQTYEVLIDPRRDYGFELRHLDEHRETGDPVAVELEERDDDVYAVSIVDA